MSRVFNPESAGKERTRLTKAVVLTVRELTRQNKPGIESRDQAAFIALALDAISRTIDLSVAAWEKRDYWVKADKFRSEWAWTGILAGKMRDAAVVENWDNIAQIAAQVAQKLTKITVAPHNRLGRPWVGSWQELMRK